MRIQKLFSLHRLAPAGDDGSDTGGTGTGNAADDAAAAAAKTAADEAAAKAAKDAADAEGKKTSDAEAKLLKDLMKYKTRAAELDKELQSAKEKVSAYEGVDLEKARAALAEQEDLERKRLEAKGDYDRLVKQMGERHGTEKTALQQQIEEARRATSSLQQQVADLTVGNSFTSSKFVAEELTLTPTKARIIYGAHFEFKDGKVVGYDKPAGASDRTVLVDATGDTLDFEDALKKLIEVDPDKDTLIRSKVKPGAGSSTVPKVGKKAESINTQALSSVDRIAAGLKALAKKS